MVETPAETGARGALNGVKGWAKKVWGRISGRTGLEQEGDEQQRRGESEREVLRHETEAAREQAEAEVSEVRQRAAEESKEASGQ